MILIGQYDSSYVRRVGIALKYYGLPFEHKPWSTFADAEKIRVYNPLHRVPTLVLDDGDVIIESHAMLDYLDGIVVPENRLFPVAGAERRLAIKTASLAMGAVDKAVPLFYELRLHDKVSDFYVARMKSQILAAVAALESDRAAQDTEYWFGSRIGHADIAVAASVRHITDSLPGLVARRAFPALAAFCAKLEALPEFQEISQPFIAPA